ncbi:TetR-like C-terminal domain-containing protein [Humidisolicoccus flavus]|uniref:TetR-like C-terminal domain-containing protein n=1 Tax=Humidisolicoccus flavus TaxID=3111414 RepID=UPI003245E908
MARAATRNKVFTAVLQIAREHRLGSISMEGVAAHAGVSKQTLYRSWSSTGAILFEALLTRSTNEEGAVEVPNTGNLSHDLQTLATAMVAELTDPSHESLLRAVTAEIQLDESLASLYRERLLTPQLDAIAERFRDHGIADTDDIAELFLGAILHRWLLRTRPFDAPWISSHVARTLRAAQHEAPSARQP